jgi:hypothetical protein
MIAKEEKRLVCRDGSDPARAILQIKRSFVRQGMAQNVDDFINASLDKRDKSCDQLQLNEATMTLQAKSEVEPKELTGMTEEDGGTAVEENSELQRREKQKSGSRKDRS